METQRDSPTTPEGDPAGTAFHADGAGGFLTLHTAGAGAHLVEAAELLRERLARLSGKSLPEWIDFQVQVADALESTHRAVPESEGISCTLLVCIGDEYLLAHLGAGRPMLYSRRFLHPLTREHTAAFESYEKGQLKATELPDHPERSRLTRGIGLAGLDAMEATSAEYRRGTLHGGDLLFLPTGDLLDHLDEDELLEELEGDAGAGEAARRLAERAAAEGALHPGCLLLRRSEEGHLQPGWFEARPGTREEAAPLVEDDVPEWVDGDLAQETGDQLLREQPLMPVNMPPEVMAVLSGKSVDEALAAREPPPEETVRESTGESDALLEGEDLPDWVDGDLAPESADSLLREMPLMPVSMPPEVAAILGGSSKKAEKPASAKEKPTSSSEPPASSEDSRERTRQAVDAAMKEDSEPVQPRRMAPAEQPPPPKKKRKAAEPDPETGSRPARTTGRVHYPTASDQRGERWIDIGHEGPLDSSLWVGLALLGGLAAIAALFWVSLVQA